MRRPNTNSIPMTNWGKGQATLEYLIIFAVIACVFIPLWTGGVFSRVRDSGRKFFTGSVSRIIGDSEAIGPLSGGGGGGGDDDGDDDGNDGGDDINDEMEDSI